MAWVLRSFHVFFEENIYNLCSWYSAAVFSPTYICVCPEPTWAFCWPQSSSQAGKLCKLLQSEEALPCDSFSGESHSKNFQVTQLCFPQWVCLDFLLSPSEGMLWVLMRWQGKQTLSRFLIGNAWMFNCVIPLKVTSTDDWQKHWIFNYAYKIIKDCYGWISCFGLVWISFNAWSWMYAFTSVGGGKDCILG